MKQLAINLDHSQKFDAGEIEIIETGKESIRHADKINQGKLMLANNRAEFIEYMPDIYQKQNINYIGNSSYIHATVYKSETGRFIVQCHGFTCYPVKKKKFRGGRKMKYYDGQFSFSAHKNNFDDAIQVALDWLNCRLDEGLPPKPELL